LGEWRRRRKKSTRHQSLVRLSLCTQPGMRQGRPRWGEEQEVEEGTPSSYRLAVLF